MLTCDQNEFDLDIILSSWCKFEGENTLPEHSKSCSKLSSLCKSAAVANIFDSTYWPLSKFV